VTVLEQPRELDPVLADAVELARAALLDDTRPGQVGDHLEVVADDELMATHYFECTDRAYGGWRWAVTVVRIPQDSSPATVSEVVLLPGGEALRPPVWVPWSQRVRPGDLGPGDLHPTLPDDPRLEPGYTGSDALEEADDPASPHLALRPEQWELGLGRETVLSVYGRDLAVERWHDERGPASAMAKAAPAHCQTCGYLMPIGGLVGQAFGVCANPFGADGTVVALGYGCGAHSSVREIEGTGIPVTDVVMDEYGYVEVHAREADDPTDELVQSRVVMGEERNPGADQMDVVDIDDEDLDTDDDAVLEEATEDVATLDVLDGAAPEVDEASALVEAVDVLDVLEQAPASSD